MRRILIDHARKVSYAKRGGGVRKVSVDEACVLAEERAADLVALDDALTALARVDERKSRVVELRYFGGLSVDETAEVLGVHPDTVTREWRRAKTFLRRELEAGGERLSPPERGAGCFADCTFSGDRSFLGLPLRKGSPLGD